MTASIATGLSALYLPSTIKAGLQHVEDLKTTACPTQPLKPLPAVLPPGITRKGNGLTCTASAALVGYDLTGWLIAVYGDGVVLTISQAKLCNPGQGRLISIGATNGGVVMPGAAKAVVTDTDLDMTGILQGNASPIDIASGSAEFLRCRLHNAPRDLINGGNFKLTLCYLGVWGLNPKLNDHLEPDHATAGDVEIDQCFIDGASCVIDHAIAGETALGYPESLAPGPMTWTSTRSIWTGTVHHGLPYALQACARNGPLRARLGGNVVERGTHGYLGPTQLPGQVLTVEDLGGNLDAVTGQPIDLTWPAAAARAPSRIPTTIA